MRPYGIELRHALTKWLTPAVVLLLVFFASSAVLQGVLLWASVTTGLTQAAAAINPLIAGFFTFESGRREQQGFQSRISGAVRSSWTPRLVHFLAMLTWPAAAAAASVIGVFVTVAAHHGYGVPSLLWLIESAAGSVLCAAIGYAVGVRWARRWFAAPIVAVAVLIGNAVLTYRNFLPYWVVQLYPTALNSSDAFVKYVHATFIGQTIWYLALSALVLLFLPRRGRERRLAVTVAVPIAVIAILGAGAVSTTHGQATIGYNARDYSCDRRPVDICVNTAYKAGLPQLESTFHTFNTRVSGTTMVATKLEQNDMGEGDVTSAGARSLYLYDLSPTFATDAIQIYVQTVGGINKCTDGNAALLHTIVDLWLEGQPDTMAASTDLSPGTLVAKEFTGLSEAAKHQWLTTHQDAYLDCTLTQNDFS